MRLHFLHHQLALLLALLAMGVLRAAPYGPEGMAIQWKQPNGAEFNLRVFGDEFHGRTETSDGYTVVFDPATQTYFYANVSPDGENLVSTGMALGAGDPATLGLARHISINPDAAKAKALARFGEWDEDTENSVRWSELKAQRKAIEDAAAQTKSSGGSLRAPPSFTTIGSKVGLTLLIDFSDDPATIPQANIIEYCNGDNYTGYGNNGSVKKYFQDNSNNLLTYTNTVTAYIRMAQPKSYYNDTSLDAGARGRLLISDAIDIMKALPNYATEILPTFGSLTVDGSNRIAACNVFFAGGNSGVWSKGLWPHSWVLATSKELSAGGKKVYRYQITNLGNSLTLGTFCHENGHMLLGYPDIYDYDYDSVGGAGGFCLMNSGGHGTNPVLINAYLKRASGWTTTTDIDSSSNLTATLVSSVGHADYNKIYRYAKPGTPTEYFIFENRRKAGRDANIAASGIAIWHIDELGDHDNQSLVPNTTHANYEVTLVQADNLWHFQNDVNSGDSRDLYYSGNTAATYTNSFSDNTSPRATWWDGTSSGLNAYNFSVAGETMTVEFGLPPNTIAVRSPNGGEKVYFGTTREITWDSNTPGNVKIELLKGGSLHTVLSASEANDGSYPWLVSAELPTGNDYAIRISSVATPAFSDDSDAAFFILAQPTLADALDASGLVWTVAGDSEWFPQSTTTHDGLDAAQSGPMTDNQSNSIETTVAGPGTLTFWWKVSSESNWDYLRFYLDGVEQTGSLAKISGNVDWIQKTVVIPAGSHIVKWAYTKDTSVSSGADAGWVDEVVYIPSSSPEIAVEQPVGTGLADGGATIGFGSVNTGSQSSPLAFTVRNTGTANLTNLALSKDGTHSADFTLGTLGATTLVPGASTTFTVTFSPGGTGARNAFVRIASNDVDENPFDIALTGTGLGPGYLAVTPAGGLTSSGTYGGSFSPISLQYTLSNPGGTAIEWTAGKGQGWVTLGATSGTLAPGASTSVSVSIDPSASALDAGGYSDTVTFNNTTNGTGNATRGVTLAVNPIPVAVTLGNLAQTYDGNPKPVSVTTAPASIAHSVSYTPSGVPVNAGTYPVTATVTAPNHIGGASGSLVIAKAAQTITFPPFAAPIGDDAAPFALGGSASSGLAVSYASSDTDVATVSGGTLTVVGPGTAVITASQPGDGNHDPAASVQRSLTVYQSNLAEALIHEPFGDGHSTLNGNTAGRGLAGTWQGSGKVIADSLDYGSLPAGTGNTASISNQNGYASVGPGLAANGLLDDGSSLWFGMLVRTGGDIATNGDLGFAFGTDPINSGNNIPISNNGAALGFTFKNDQLRASQWAPGLVRSANNTGNGATSSTLYLIVGKITWGASSETIEIYRPAANLELGGAVSAYTTATNLDQSLFDTISFAGKSANPDHFIDEIRIGASYASVVGLGSPGSVDHFTISPIASMQTVGTPITGITITARNSSNATATGFTGTVTFGGTGGFSGTSANFTAGVLENVSITPALAGGNLTFTVDDKAGHTGTATIGTIQTKYAAWAGASPFGDDANGDGVANGLAWVLGAPDSNANAMDLLPDFSTAGGNMLFTFERSQASINPNTSVVIEVGTTLGSWPDVYIVGETSASSAAGVTVSKDTPVAGTDTITLSVPISPDTRKFARLKVTETP